MIARLAPGACQMLHLIRLLGQPQGGVGPSADLVLETSRAGSGSPPTSAAVSGLWVSRWAAAA